MFAFARPFIELCIGTHRKRVVFVALVVCLFGGDSSFGQFAETFESTELGWRLRDTDCRDLRSDWNQQRLNEQETQNKVEQFFFNCGPGTKILVSHEIPASFVIPELTTSVRIKSARTGVQLMLRVVLPHTETPGRGGPMRTLLPGPIYDTAGQWQTLTMGGSEELTKQLQQKIWVLRREYGKQVTQKDAYIDAVVLNLYTGSGENTCQTDDLTVNGIVDASIIKKRFGQLGSSAAPASPGNVRTTSFQQESERRPSLVVRDGSVLEVKGKPFFPKIIQHRGEPFEFLKSLGFNTVQLKSTASKKQLEQAEQLGLWIICPAPASAGLRDIPFAFDRVFAWSLGSNLTGNDLNNVRQRIREIRESDSRTGRPVAANVASHWKALGQEVDALSVGVAPFGSSFIASGYSDWIRKRIELIGNSKPVWADIQTEMTPSVARQIAAIASQAPPTPVEPQQIKYLIYEAIAGGSRGLRFTSFSRLDAADPESRLRAQTIQWALACAEQLEPWAVGGALMGPLETDRSRLKVTAINNPSSRLLLIQRPTHHEQYWAGDVPLETVSFHDATSTFTDRAYLITETGMVPLPNQRSHSGVQLTLDECPYVAAVVLTQDPQVITRLNSEKSLSQTRMLDAHAQITGQWIAIMQLVDQQMNRIGRASPGSSGALNEAINAFRKANELLTSGTPTMGIGFLNRADERLSLARRELMTVPLGKFQSKTSTPFLTHVSLVPIHWQIANRLSKAIWNLNTLPGGDFEHLPLMTKNGWENRRTESSAYQSDVKLSEAAAAAGRYGLEMSVTANGPISGPLPTVPLSVESAHVSVRAGQLVRIHGWINIPRVIVGSHDGLLITDSLGGPPMAERIPVTKGWQEFTLYRGAAKSGPMYVTFSLTGIGKVMLDEVTIRTIDMQSVRQAQR